ncbi:MAG TPA: PQQ-binding-like beta-propeller repeat protein [Longimicrobium sp.]
MRSTAPRLSVSRAAAALWLLALSACFEGGDNPFTPGGGNAGTAAFGAEALEWWTPDSIGGWTMVPLLNGPNVYFERDMQVAGGVVTRSAELVALDRADGGEVWSSPIITASNAVVAGGRIGPVWGSLPIFDPATGTRLHTYRFGETSLSGTVASDGARFYATTHDGYAVAVNPATGTAAWETNLAGGANTAGFGVAVAGEAVAVTLKHLAASTADRDSGIVAVLERGTGAVRWRTRVQSNDPAIVEPPVVVAGMVIVVTQGHDVRAYNLQTGALVWSFDASAAPGTGEVASHGLAACEDLVVVPTGGMGLVALTATTGAPRWQLGDIGGGSLLGVQCENGRVLALGGGLRVFNAYTGARLAVYPRREPPPLNGRSFTITGAVSDGEFLYVATSHGYAKVQAP